MARMISMMMAAVLVLGVATGCRQWRTQANEYKSQQRTAGTLIGKSPDEVREKLGKPSMTYGQGGNTVYEYSYVDSVPDDAAGFGLNKPVTARESGTTDTTINTMRVYFQDGKMVGVRGN